MAFPTQRQSAEDPQFLRPFNPDGFDPPRFLFRIDNAIEDDCPRAVILVQSDVEPSWDYAFRNARTFLAAEPEWKEYDPTFTAGQEFRFRIRINLSKKSQTSKNGTDLQKHKVDEEGRPRTQSKRVSLTWNKDQKPDEAIHQWFAGKGDHHGFALRDFRLLHVGWVTGYRPGKKTPCDEHDDGHSERRMKFRSALLEGTLTVTDAPVFSRAIASGLGSAKAFGFGLLSVAPL
jgi:CRISPR system Cascade subunit CasE